MKAARKPRGGALVGSLSALGAWQAELILNVRLWSEGPWGRSRVWNRMAKTLPPDSARDELIALDRLIDLTGVHAHLPLVRRRKECTCICSDEAIFLYLVETACEGDPHEARQVACLLVKADHADRIACLAAQVGRMAKAVSRQSPPSSNAPHGTVVWLH